MKIQTQKIDPGKFFNRGEPMPYVNINLRGDAGSGKSYTAGILAKGIWQSGGYEKGVIICDTEQSVKFLRPLFTMADKKTGEPLLRELDPADPQNQLFICAKPSLADVCGLLDWMNEGNADIMIVDSVSTIYKNFIEEYRADKRKGGRLTMQDWDYLKTTWAESFTERMVHQKGNIIACGRLANVYEMAQGEDPNKKEFVKTGVKTRGDSDGAYEFDINVHMQKREEIGRIGKSGQTLPDRVWREATVLKSRFPAIDGKTFNANGASKGPSYSDFQQAIEFVIKASIGDGPTQRFKNTEVTQNGETPADQEQRKIEIERIVSDLRKIYPAGSQSNVTILREDLLAEAFDGERSIKALDQFDVEKLQAGRLIIQRKYRELNPPDAVPEDFFS